jgi:pilus assembly protein CpaE
MTDPAAPTALTGATGQAPRAMVFTRDKASEGVVRQCLMGLGVADAQFRPGGVDQAIAEVSSHGPIKLLIVDADGEFPLAAISNLLAACSPSTGVVVLGESNDLSLYRHLRDLGVADYIFKPLVSALVTRACDRVLTGAHEREGAPLGQLISFLGVRGGVGATTLAVRTAWELASLPPRPVALIDLQLRFGDAALQLDVAPNDALQEALRSLDRVDELFIERGVTHVADRLDLMASLAPVNQQPEFSEEAVLKLLEQLQRRYRYVVLDVPVFTAGLMPRALQLASTFILVSDGRLASARDVRRWRDALGPDAPDRTILHILNRHGGPGDLPMEDFMRAAGEGPDIVIPFARDIGAASNAGIRARPDCPELQRALAPLLERVAGQSPAHGRPLLSRIFG